MKRTRKWSFVEQEAQRLASMGLSALEIARQIGVTKSTVNRWIASGKLKPGKSRASTVSVQSAGTKAPAQWADIVRREYALDATDEQLLTCAQQALELAYNMAETPSTRVAAMGRFQAIVKQLALVTRSVAAVPEPEKPAPRPIIRRSGIDPRNVLQAVK